MHNNIYKRKEGRKIFEILNQVSHILTLLFHGLIKNNVPFLDAVYIIDVIAEHDLMITTTDDVSIYRRLE